MKTTLSILSAALMLAFSAQASAHGCSGSGACQTINHKPESHAQGGASTANGQNEQGQQQRQESASNSSNSSSIDTSNRSRYLNVRPVVVPSTPIVTPAANVSRYASSDCGPRMKIVHRDVHGLNNRMTRAEAIDAGFDQYVVPDVDQPYRKIQIMPDVFQLIGHRMIETTAVPNISTSGGFGIGGNVNAGGGASFGMQSGGALQRVVTTIRLQECVAYEVDTRPLTPRG